MPDLSPEQSEHIRQYNAYYGRPRDAQDEARYVEAIKAIEHFAEEAEWFAENTPKPFATAHWSYIHTLAHVCCRYVQKFARLGNEEAIRELATLAVNLTETLTDLLTEESAKADKIAELVKWWEAEKLPYWPMLYFRNTAANNYAPRIADKIGLGKKCYLNVSDKANYSLQTPINRFVWKCLRHFQEIHSILDRVEREKETVEKKLESYVFCEVIGHRKFVAGMIHREEIPIYKQTRKLPLLTKANAEKWADVAIMPYVKIRFPDLRKVEELKGLKTGINGKSYAPLRKAVIQALKQVARKP